MTDENKLIEPLIFDSEEMRSKFIRSDSDDIRKNTPTPIKGMDFDVYTKSVEEKLYIILYKINDDTIPEDQCNIYSLCVGRTEAYNDIKNKILSGVDVDIHRSKIITETKQTDTNSGDRKYFLIPYEECISIYSFCISVRDYYSYDEFDIDDYNNSEVPDNTNELDSHQNYLTADQIQYRNMLNAAMNRNSFIDSIRNLNSNSTNNI